MDLRQSLVFGLRIQTTEKKQNKHKNEVTAYLKRGILGAFSRGSD